MKLMGYSQFIATVRLAETVSTRTTIWTVIVKMNSVMIDQVFLRMIACLTSMDKANRSPSSMIA